MREKLLKITFCITGLASLTISLAEKLKMQVVATTHWCRLNLVAVGVYRSREVRELCHSAAVLGASSEHCSELYSCVLCIWKEINFFYWVQLMSCDVKW